MAAKCLLKSICRHPKKQVYYYSINSKSNIRKNNIDLYSDPTIELQQYLKTPLFGEYEKPFEPSKTEIIQAQNLFTQKTNHEIKFLRPLFKLEDFPKGNIPEVVFIGQSNSGKSSLLKAVFRDVPNLEVKTSKKFGHTKTLNLFQVGKKLYLLDAPGYGWKQPGSFVSHVEKYLQTSRNLQRIFLLTDAVTGFSDWDMIAIKMLEEFRRPYALIVTKIDLATHSQRLRCLFNLQEIRDKYSSPSCFPQPFLVSNLTFEGIAYLKAFIAYITFNLTLN